jgi:hypothetical protein
LEVELQNEKPFGGHCLLEEPHGDVRGKKHRAPFQEKIPCKLQVIIHHQKNTSNSQGI